MPIFDPKNSTSDRWRDVALIALLLLLAMSLRGWLLCHTEVLARDSIGFIRYALEFETDTWNTVLRNNHQHPGYPLSILAVSVPVRAWSTAPEPDAMSLSAQLASSLAAVLLIIPMYFLGKLLFHPAAGFGAAALFQCLPVPAHILSDGLSEALFLLLACAALALAVWALRGSKPWPFALAGAFCGLSYLTRPEGALILVATWGALAGLQLAKVQRRSPRQLWACGASMTVMALVVGSPYVLATHRITNKPSVYQWLGDDRPDLGVELPDARGKQALSNAGPSRPLFACVFGITLDLRVGFGQRALQAVCGLIGEMVKCFHYLACLPALLGVWWFRSRLATVPGLWVVLLLCVLSTLGLWWLAVEVGYLSDRHLLLLVMCGCYAAAAAVWELPSRFRAWRRGQQWTTSAAQPHTAFVAVLLLCAIIVAGLPKSLQKLHANRAGHHAAGLWLASHAAPADIIEDDHCWAHYYAGRVFQEHRSVPSSPGYVPTRYIVIGRRDKEINLTWNNAGPRDEAKLREEGGSIVYHWPAPSNPADASIVVYAVPPTAPGGEVQRD
jgi:Dolichyl-phosphate-mannose-protein mannosyltransferase